MPPLQKRKRQILRRWHIKSEEIKKLKAMQTAAEQNRKLLLQQEKEIGRIRHSTQQIKEKIKDSGTPKSSPRVAKKSEATPSTPHMTSSTPVAELSNILNDDASETASEIDMSSSSSSSILKSLKSRFPVSFDERKLTKRELRLQQRRKHAEQLLKWKQQLDEEEKNVISLEQHLQKLESRDPKDVNDLPDDRPLTLDRPSNSESSIAEEVPSSGSTTPPTTSPPTNPLKIADKRNVKPEEKNAVASPQQDMTSQNKVSPTQNKDKKSATKSSSDPTQPLIASPGQPQATPVRVRKESIESWSDESFSQTQSETEHSDIECRVRALKEELNRRKSVADRLKKQQKRREKERLRAQEASLRNQLETLDAFICQTQNEINKELESGSTHSNDSTNHTIASKPQIRSPRKTDQSRQAARALRSNGTVSPEASPRSGSHRSVASGVLAKTRTESESSGKSSRSLSFDDEEKTPDEWPSNGAKTLVEALPSRRLPQEATKVHADKSERPKKLDLPSPKTIAKTANGTPTLSPVAEKASKIPLPVKTTTENEQSDKDAAKPTLSPQISSKEPIKSVTSQPKSSPKESRRSGIPVARNSVSPINIKRDSLTDSKVTDTSVGYSDDFDSSVQSRTKDRSDHSIKTDDDISEQLSDRSSKESDQSSSALFDLKDSNDKIDTAQDSFTGVGDDLDDDKTPTIASPVNSYVDDESWKQESESTIDNASELADGEQNNDLSKAISDAAKNFESFGHEVVDDTEDDVQSGVSKQRIAEELSEKLLKSLLEDSVNDAMEKQSDKSEIIEEKEEFEPALSESTRDLLELLSESPEQNQQTAEKDELAETLTGDLLHDTITKVLEIRKERSEKLAQDGDVEQKSPQRDFENGREVADILQSTQEASESADNDANDRSVARPVSPIFGTGANQDEPVGEWMDDDFGISSFHKQKPAATLSEKDQNLANEHWRDGRVIEVVSSRYEPPPIKFAVPHNPAHIMRLVDSAVAHVYDLQMSGNLSREVLPPGDVFDGVSSDSDSANSDDDSTKSEEKRTNSAIFKNSLFDLVKELVCEIYSSHNNPEQVPVWRKLSRKQRPAFCRRIPDSMEELSRLVRDQVTKLMNLDGETYKLDPKATMKWGARKKKDKVDLILIQELREEEPDWTNYDADEASVKLQLADTVLDMLLTDTIQCLQTIDKTQPEGGSKDSAEERSQ